MGLLLLGLASPDARATPATAPAATTAPTATAVPPERTPLPPPDPANGPADGPADGRGYGAPPNDPDWIDDLLVVPRALLWPVRRVLLLLSVPVVGGVAAVERRDWQDGAGGLLRQRHRRFTIQPTFSTEFGFAPNLGVEIAGRDLVLGSSAILDGAYAGTGKWLAQLRGRLPWPPSGETTVYGQFDERNDLAFYGIGMRSLDELEALGEGRSRYSVSPGVHAGVHSSVRLARPLTLLTRFELLRERYGPGESDSITAVFPPAQVPGFGPGVTELRPSMGLIYDTRQVTGEGPGVDGYLLGAFAQGIAGDPARFIDVSGGAAGHLDLGLGTRILTLRARAELANAFGDEPIPFTQLPSLGGLWLHGYLTGRFRDDTSLLGAVEYDWPVHRLLGAELFAEAGEVAGPFFRGLAFHEIAPDGGFEIRYFPAGGVFALYFRIAYGREGFAGALGARLLP